MKQEEWDFRSCPKQELECCLGYELARERPDIIDAVGRWRGHSKSQDFDSFLSLPVLGTNNPLIGFTDLFFLYFPEWPNLPYLAISRKERDRRLRVLSYPNKPVSLLEAYPVGQTFEPFLELKYDWDAGFIMNRSRHPCEDYMLIKIPWWSSSIPEMVQAFESALRKLRPDDSALEKLGLGKLGRKAGAGSPPRKRRDILKQLGGRRLYKRFGHPKCLDVAPLYGEQSAWIKARNAAGREIKSFLFPAHWLSANNLL